MYPKKSRSLVASAVSLALSSMMLSTSVNAGVINNSNPTTDGFLGACGILESDPTACVGAWNLDNVDVKLIKVIDGSVFDTSFDKGTGDYVRMTYGDSFRSYVRNPDATITDPLDPLYYMARVSGKDWPVGEPTGIKAINADPNVKKDGTPANCLINTSYLDFDASTSGARAYLDTAKPEPVVCSSEFQTHKRFKIAMLPATVDGVADGAESTKPIDLVFNVGANDGQLRPYQVFSKINNYTGKRLKGYKIVVGKGVGAAFQSASALGIDSQLHISLGYGEETLASTATQDLFDPDGLATFSHGLFGPIDQHFPTVGFFDERTAGFNVLPNTPGITDTIYSNGPLPSNYTTLFGEWLHAEWAPKGIFYDFDNDPTTDADLVAWWNGTAWIKNYASGFATVSATELNTWANSPLYSIDTIEDVLNLGLNYIVKVGDVVTTESPETNITIRIIPVVADTADQLDVPAWVGTTPTPLVPTTVTTSSGDGGCTTGSSGRFDPTLPALLAMGLGFFGWRRFKAGK